MADTFIRGEIVNRARCAAILGIAKTTLDEWARRGCPVQRASMGKGYEAQYDTAAVIAWRMAGAIAEADPDDIDAAKEKARLYKEQADRAMLLNAQLRCQLLPAVEVEAAWSSAIGRARSLLLGMPAAAADEIVLLAPKGPGAVRDFLADRIHEALTELATTRDDDEGEPADVRGPGEGAEDVEAADQAPSV